MQKVVRRNCVFFLSAFRRGDTKGLSFSVAFRIGVLFASPPRRFPRAGVSIFRSSLSAPRFQLSTQRYRISPHSQTLWLLASDPP